MGSGTAGWQSDDDIPVEGSYFYASKHWRNGQVARSAATEVGVKKPPEGGEMAKMVLEVGLEPTKAEAERFTVSCHCH